MAKLAQKAEHNFVGVECGLMDQYAVMFGKKNKLIKLDCRTNESEYININLENYSIVLVNSNVKHSLASSEYNTRRLECNTGINIIQNQHQEIKSLRDISLDQLQEFKFTFSNSIYNRCEYVVEENNRVLEFINLINDNKITEAGILLNETHSGLRDKYEVSCKELDLLVEQAEILDYVIGSRMMGGGFGGCTINLVKNNHIEQFKQNIENIYTNTTGITPDFYTVEITNGIEIINT